MKKSIILLSIFWIQSLLILSDAHAMDTLSTPQINYLPLLPVDILNCIIQWLDWESEKDFIERTRKQAQKTETIPGHYYNLYPNYKETDKILGIFSPDKSKCALFELLSASCYDPVCRGETCLQAKLVILDLKRHREKEKKFYSGLLEYKCYRAIAVSSSGHMIAVIRRQNISEDEKSFADKDYKDFLVIKKMNKEKLFEEKKETIIPIAECFVPYNLAFNKQHTQLIM
ncbi:MAG TPA: hypothetical protein VKU36_00540, partial [Candidatus Babeliales bacterium]|nr:hypothetical protein [Candidatus Babeliales bacterium]